MKDYPYSYRTPARAECVTPGCNKWFTKTGNRHKYCLDCRHEVVLKYKPKVIHTPEHGLITIPQKAGSNNMAQIKDPFAFDDEFDRNLAAERHAKSEMAKDLEKKADRLLETLDPKPVKVPEVRETPYKDAMPTDKRWHNIPERECDVCHKPFKPVGHNQKRCEQHKRVHFERIKTPKVSNPTWDVHKPNGSVVKLTTPLSDSAVAMLRCMDIDKLTVKTRDGLQVTIEFAV